MTLVAWPDNRRGIVNYLHTCKDEIIMNVSIFHLKNCFPSGTRVFLCVNRKQEKNQPPKYIYSWSLFRCSEKIRATATIDSSFLYSLLYRALRARWNMITSVNGVGVVSIAFRQPTQVISTKSSILNITKS